MWDPLGVLVDELGLVVCIFTDEMRKCYPSRDGLFVKRLSANISVINSRHLDTYSTKD